jgi:hypothetical protein
MVPLFCLLSYIYVYVCKGIIEGPWQLVDCFLPFVQSIQPVWYLKLHTQKHDNYQTFTSLLKLKAIGMDVPKKTTWRYK